MSEREPEQREESTQALVLRREAMLPSERSRGLGTVAVVCTMAGVASGLALATTLMAMQVADSLSSRAPCPYVAAVPVAAAERADEHGFLGVRYSFERGAAVVATVLPGTPAEAVGLRAGDRITSLDGQPVESAAAFQLRIYESPPGSLADLVVERGGRALVVHPTLAAWPSSDCDRFRR